ncbi:tRNA wybutosine-synthesizing protein 3-like protein, partial [Stegodyphus mimosarum]
MDFSTRKELLLKKVDLSKKGSIDSRITELVNFINSLDNYVTTSSCSGRAIVFTNTNKKK